MSAEAAADMSTVSVTSTGILPRPSRTPIAKPRPLRSQISINDQKEGSVSTSNNSIHQENARPPPTFVAVDVINSADEVIPLMNGILNLLTESPGLWSCHVTKALAVLNSGLKEFPPNRWADQEQRKDVDRKVAQLQGFCASEQIAMVDRLNIIEMIELSALGWNSNSNTDSYYTHKKAANSGEKRGEDQLSYQQKLVRSRNSDSILPPSCENKGPSTTPQQLRNVYLCKDGKFGYSIFINPRHKNGTGRGNEDPTQKLELKSENRNLLELAVAHLETTSVTSLFQEALDHRDSKVPPLSSMKLHQDQRHPHQQQHQSLNKPRLQQQHSFKGYNGEGGGSVKVIRQPFIPNQQHVDGTTSKENVGMGSPRAVERRKMFALTKKAMSDKVKEIETMTAAISTSEEKEVKEKDNGKKTDEVETSSLAKVDENLIRYDRKTLIGLAKENDKALSKTKEEELEKVLADFPDLKRDKESRHDYANAEWNVARGISDFTPPPPTQLPTERPNKNFLEVLKPNAPKRKWCENMGQWVEITEDIEPSRR